MLRPDGTLWLNIGDSYRNKNLIGIPWMLAFALRADGWYLRQDIIWYKPNAMPESVKDRCTKSHEHVFLLAKSARYYFDAVAIREPVMGDSTKRYLRMCGGQADTAALPRFGGSKYGDSTSEETRYKSGKEYKPTPYRNKRDVWIIGASGYQGTHFAVFPEKLVEPCVLAGCPEGGTVLDPFTGSGTTGVVAKRLRRNFTGIELNPEYREMALARIGAAETEYEQMELRAGPGAYTGFGHSITESR